MTGLRVPVASIRARSARSAAEKAATGARSSRSSAALAEELEEERERGPSRLLHGGVAAREAERAEVGDAREAGRVAEEELAAPDRAVGPVAGAVPRDAERGPVGLVLGEAGGEVGVVVLDGDEAEAPRARRGEDRGRQRPLRLVPRRGAAGPAGREVVGVEVVRDGDRLGLPEAEEVGDDALERGERLGRLEVADVLREDDLAPEAEADDVLQVRADGEDGGSFAATGTGSGAKPRARRRSWSSSPVEPADAVVGVPLDGAVVDEEEVGEVTEPRDGLGLVRRDRLVGEVAARRDERDVDGLEEEVVERRRREHEAEARRLGGDVRRDAGGRRAAAGGGSAPRGRGATARPRPRPRTGRARRRGPSPSGRAASRAAPSRREGAPRRPAFRAVAAEVEAAEPLHRDDAARRGAPPPRAGAPRRPARGPGRGVFQSARRGPHAGQAVGWAWKRRSRGSSYSRRQSAQRAKPAIVVFGRSYGSARTIVKRGPQFVQFRNG